MSKLKTLAQWRAEKGLIKENQEDADTDVHMKYARMMLDKNVGKTDPAIMRKLRYMIDNAPSLAGLAPNEKFATLVTSVAAAVYPEIASGRNVSFSGADRKIDQEAGMATPVA